MDAIKNRAAHSHTRGVAIQPRASRSAIRLAVATALAGAALSPLSARAEPAADAADVSGAGLQEVIVTARKRSENLQDVPVSIDVFTQKDLQNLNITRFDDYASKVPSISFISVGPGTQIFFLRGVSDGSNPNYSNTSSTGFFLDDVSLTDTSVQPDLHLYDIQRIEVLNGPQGTTFGAGSMAGAVRYITNPPNVNAFSAGADFDGGKIQGGGENWTYEAFVNVPLIDGRLGLRMSAFSASHGGFIDNVLTTRHWKNGTVSDNSAWAHKKYNREHQEGARVALKAMVSDRWSATLTYDYQRQAAIGAWDEDLNTPGLGPRKVSRFGPESHHYQDKLLTLHVDGDVGIGDLVFASSYWSQPTRQLNEYSQYMENVSYSGYNTYTHSIVMLPAGYKEAFTCAHGPYPGNPTQPYSGCNVPLQFYDYRSDAERWSDELRLASKPGGRFHWLGGLYWEKTRDPHYGSTFYEPGLDYQGDAFQYYAKVPSFEPGVWFKSRTRSDYLQTTEFANISFDLTDRLKVEAGIVHFHSDFRYFSMASGFTYQVTPQSSSSGSSHKWNSKLGANYKITDKVMVYADFSQGFRDGGTNSGYTTGCYNKGVPYNYVPDTLNNFEVGWKSTSLGGKLLWNGAVYLMNWKNLQTLIYDINICAPSSFNANVGDARIYGVESNLDYRLTDNWSIQASASYTDSHLISSPYPTFEPNVGERLPYVPYFNYSANLRYEHPLSAGLHGYAQFDIAHKGNMWNDLHVVGSHGIPRILQPGYTLMNLRFGLNPEGGHWLAEFYITNLADKNAIIYSNTGNFDLRETTNEPRVFGLRLNYRFGKETNAAE